MSRGSRKGTSLSTRRTSGCSGNNGGTQMDVALFGAGRIGKIHAGNVARQPGVTLRYVVDVDAAAARSLAQQHGAQVASVETALADKAVGAVVIGSSTDTHSD